MKSEIVRNIIKCKKCGDIIESITTHDFKWCSCGACAVDGGHDYLRRVGNQEDWEEKSITTQKADNIVDDLAKEILFKKNKNPDAKYVIMNSKTYYDNFITYSFAVSVNKIYDLEILISNDLDDNIIVVGE